MQTLERLPQCSIAPLDCEKTLADVRCFLVQMKRMDEPVSGTLVSKVILDKFPPKLQDEVIVDLEMKYPGEVYKTDRLIETLESRVRVMRVIEERTRTGEPYGLNSVNRANTFAAQNSRNRFELCAICDGRHHTWDCNAWNTSTRRDTATQRRLCFKCLCPGHHAGRCMVSGYPKCSCGNHNEVVCSRTSRSSDWRSRPRDRHEDERDDHFQRLRQDSLTQDSRTSRTAQRESDDRRPRLVQFTEEQVEEIRRIKEFLATLKIESDNGQEGASSSNAQGSDSRRNERNRY